MWHVFLFSVAHSVDVPRQFPLTVAELGDNLTLTCPVTGSESSLFYWYKMKFGYMVQTVAAGSSYKISLQGQFKNSRFNLAKDDSLHFLHITNVSKEDEATYICQSGAAYVMKFTDGTVLVVNGKYVNFIVFVQHLNSPFVNSCLFVTHVDPKNHQKSISVQQSPVTASVDPGALINHTEPTASFQHHQNHHFNLWNINNLYIRLSHKGFKSCLEQTIILFSSNTTFTSYFLR